MSIRDLITIIPALLACAISVTACGDDGSVRSAIDLRSSAPSSCPNSASTRARDSSGDRYNGHGSPAR